MVLPPQINIWDELEIHTNNCNIIRMVYMNSVSQNNAVLGYTILMG